MGKSYLGLITPLTLGGTSPRNPFQLSPLPTYYSLVHEEAARLQGTSMTRLVLVLSPSTLNPSAIPYMHRYTVGMVALKSGNVTSADGLRR